MTLGCNPHNPPPQRRCARALLRPASREPTQLRFGLAVPLDQRQLHTGQLQKLEGLRRASSRS